MTGQTLYENALALIATQPDEAPEFGPFALPLINLLLAETAGVNEGLRAWHSLAPLPGIPALAALSDELPCEPELAAALPYGLCAKFMPDEDDLQKAAYFGEHYAAALSALKRCEAGAVRDFYCGGPAR